MDKRDRINALKILLDERNERKIEEEKDKHRGAISGTFKVPGKVRESFERWVREENRYREIKLDHRGADLDPNFNAYYVAAKLPPYLYARFYNFCKTNNWSKSTAIKFAIHQLLSTES
tara:strand:+ start:100 stop:453 length:354 start_codon:yes stop_codon:yes gene_type:complete